MLLSELVRSSSDRELESALRAFLSARKAGSVTTVSYAQLAKAAGLTSISKGAFDNFIEKHPELQSSVEQSSDNGIALADPSQPVDSEPVGDEPEMEPADDTGADAAAPDVSLAPDAMDDMGAGIDLSAGTNTGAPLTPDTRVSPDQGNGARPHPQEYDQVQKAAQRALGRRN